MLCALNGAGKGRARDAPSIKTVVFNRDDQVFARAAPPTPDSSCSEASSRPVDVINTKPLPGDDRDPLEHDPLGNDSVLNKMPQIDQ